MDNANSEYVWYAKRVYPTKKLGKWRLIKRKDLQFMHPRGKHLPASNDERLRAIELMNLNRDFSEVDKLD